MKQIICMLLVVTISQFVNAQTIVTPAQITNFQNGTATANENEVYLDNANNLYYIGLSSGKVKFLQDSIKTNSTLTGTGTAGNVLALAQNGATNGQILRWNGSTWAPSGDGSANNWLITGNSNAVNGTNFLGTINDVPLTLTSNNTPMLRVGRRETLGLWDNASTGLFPYNQQNGSVAYIQGAGGVSALQFQADAASFYRPVFFTDGNGNFQMRGSAAQTDFFELGSAGTVNDGQLLFTIGDDGDEPVIFRKYNYSTQSYVEMMRLQGTGLNNQVRAGINMSGTVANSTFQVTGSVSTSVTSTATALTLDETHRTVIVTANVNITLPAAGTCTGREYVVKKTFNGSSTISSFIDTNGAASTTLARGVYVLQSDGTNWQRL